MATPSGFLLPFVLHPTMRTQTCTDFKRRSRAFDRHRWGFVASSVEEDIACWHFGFVAMSTCIDVTDFASKPKFIPYNILTIRPIKLTDKHASYQQEIPAGSSAS